MKVKFRNIVKSLLVVSLIVAYAAQSEEDSKVLYCGTMVSAGIVPGEKPRTSSFQTSRFTMKLSSVTFPEGTVLEYVVPKGITYGMDGYRVCERPSNSMPHVLKCSKNFDVITYNIKTGVGVSASFFNSDDLPSGGDTPLVSMFRCNIF